MDFLYNDPMDLVSEHPVDLAYQDPMDLYQEETPKQTPQEEEIHIKNRRRR